MTRSLSSSSGEMLAAASVCPLDRHRPPVERVLGGVRQGGDDREPLGYFEGREPVTAVLQDLLGRDALALGYDHCCADTFSGHRVGDREPGRLSDTTTFGEDSLDMLGRDLLATAVDDVLAPGGSTVGTRVGTSSCPATQFLLGQADM